MTTPSSFGLPAYDQGKVAYPRRPRPDPALKPTEYRFKVAALPRRRARFIAVCCGLRGPTRLNQSALSVRVVPARVKVYPVLAKSVFNLLIWFVIWLAGTFPPARAEGKNNANKSKSDIMFQILIGILGRYATGVLVDDVIIDLDSLRGRRCWRHSVLGKVSLGLGYEI